MPYIYKIHAMADGSRSSSAGSTRKVVTPVFLRWLMPSVADLIFVAILGALVFTPLSVKLLNDAGIGWHVRTGQLILSTHQVPREDPFSSQISLRWFAWEWLYDVAVGKLEAWCGLNGVVWLTAVVIAAAFAGTFRLAVKRGTNLLAALILTLLALSASMIHFLARPHVFTWLFALVWFCILDSTESDSRRSGRRLWILPVLMVVWVNVHGGFLLGFVILASYWIASLWTWLRSKESRLEESLHKISAGKRTRVLMLVGIASALASLLNPYGWNLHEHIYEYLTNRFFMDHIDEFQSPNFHGVAQKCFLILLLISIAAMAARGGRLRLSQVLLALFAISAALFASRNIPVSSILLVLIVGPLVPQLGFGRFTQKMGAVDSGLRGHLWPLVASVATLAIAANGGHVGTKKWMDAHFDPLRMPVDAVNFLRNKNARAYELQDARAAEMAQCHPFVPMFSPDYWGGYLIYRNYPNNKVVFDDRHDFYGEWRLQKYLTLMHLEPGWEKWLDWFGGCMILPKSAPLTSVLSKSPEWKMIYTDDVAAVIVPAKWPPEDRDKVPAR